MSDHCTKQAAPALITAQSEQHRPCGAGASTGVACHGCPKGKADEKAASTTCQSCAPGKYWMADPSRCVVCIPGTFQSLSGQVSCTECSSGRYNDGTGTAATCISCGVGVSSTGLACYDCPAGKADEKASSTAPKMCQSCAPGKHWMADPSRCVVCTPGKISSLSGQVSCTECSSGRYNDGTGTEATCISCGAGVSSTGIACNDCPTGKADEKAASTTVSKMCQSCAPGKYWMADPSRCVVCIPGKFQSLSGQVTCTECSSGRYNDGTGTEATCKSCPSGEGTFGKPGAFGCSAHGQPSPAPTTATPTGQPSTAPTQLPTQLPTQTPTPAPTAFVSFQSISAVVSIADYKRADLLKHEEKFLAAVAKVANVPDMAVKLTDADSYGTEHLYASVKIDLPESACGTSTAFSCGDRFAAKMILHPWVHALRKALLATGVVFQRHEMMVMKANKVQLDGRAISEPVSPLVEDALRLENFTERAANIAGRASIIASGEVVHFASRNPIPDVAIAMVCGMAFVVLRALKKGKGYDRTGVEDTESYDRVDPESYQGNDGARTLSTGTGYDSIQQSSGMNEDESVEDYVLRNM
jgi:hypothetical protein